MEKRWMTTALLMLSAIAALLMVPALSDGSDAAENVVVGSLVYDLDEATHEATLKGYDPSSVYPSNYLTDSEFTYGQVKYKVTAVADYAFYQSVIPEVVELHYLKTIGFKSFAGCVNLLRFDLKSVNEIGGYSLYGSGVTTADLASCSSIGTYAFKNAPLQEVSFSKSLSTMGKGAFSGWEFHDFGDVPLTASANNLRGKAFNVDFTKGDESHLFRSIGVGYVITDPQGLAYKVTAFGTTNQAEVFGMKGEDVPDTMAIPSTISQGDYAFNVVRIADKAFYQNAGIKAVEFQGNVSIGQKAFASCKDLQEVVFSDVDMIGDYAFYRCPLMELSLPEDGAVVGNSAFSGCTSIKVLRVPDSDFQFGSNVFCGLKLHYHDGVSQIQPASPDFAGHVYSGAGAKLVMEGDQPGIGEEFIRGCMKYRVESVGTFNAVSVVGFVPGAESAYVTIPSSVDYGSEWFDVLYVADKAFYRNQVIKHVDLGEGVESVGCKAFAASSLESVVFGPNVWDLAPYSFAKSALRQLDLPPQFETIGASAFSGCTGLELVVFHDGWYEFESNVFYGLKFFRYDGTTRITTSDEDFIEHSYAGTGARLVMMADSVGQKFDYGDLKYRLTSVGAVSKAEVVGYADGCSTPDLDVPMSFEYGSLFVEVDAIADKAFRNNSYIKSIYLGGVHIIGDRAFSLSTLEYVMFGAELYEIHAYAFYRCPLDALLIPWSVEGIGEGAFRGCTSLTSVYFDGAPSVENDSFRGVAFYWFDGRTVIPTDSDQLAPNCYVGKNGKLVMITDFAVGDEFEYYGLKYRITSMSLTAELIGFAYQCFDGEVVVPDHVVYNDHCFEVTSVGASAFKGTDLVFVDLGNVRTVGMKAFANCSYLKNVCLPDVTSIGPYAFYGCPAVIGIQFGEGLQTVGSNAFHGFSFYDKGGNAITRTAENLAGRSFSGNESGWLHLI